VKVQWQVIITNEFDPVIVDGKLDPRSYKIRDAVIGLGQTGLIETKMVLDSLAVTKDRATGEDVTSTVLKTSTMNEETGSRAMIDQMAGPANTRKRARSASIDLGKPAKRVAVQQATREFQNLSRPEPFEFFK